MIAVNLLNWRERARQRLLRRWLGLSITLLLLSQLALLCGWQRLSDNTQRWQNQFTLWRQADEQAQQLAQRYEAAQSQRETLSAQSALREQRRQRLAQWQALMLLLESSMPDEVWLSALTHQQHALQLEGLSLRPEAARQLLYRLRDAASFPLWQPGALQKRADGLYHFTLATGRSEDVSNEK